MDEVDEHRWCSHGSDESCHLDDLPVISHEEAMQNFAARAEVMRELSRENSELRADVARLTAERDQMIEGFIAAEEEIAALQKQVDQLMSMAITTDEETW